MGYEMMEWPDLKRSQKDQTSVFVFCSLHVTNADERVDSYGDMVKLIHQRFEDPGKMMEAYFDFESQLKRRRVYVFFKDRQVIGYCLKRKDGKWLSNVNALNKGDQIEFLRKMDPLMRKDLGIGK
ncbi:hypothetical protein [uncultured Dubosiella sp.]|uniref:hypothetical protein n=1 Tax=uncultured Dubosiella sp. TaxID=1937011 RepID=UPI00272E73DD|nr:hypothetical protein [uncultured Dubosiella sp.]